MDLTEAEDTKKRWQEYTEELYKKDLNDPNNQDGVIILKGGVIFEVTSWRIAALLSHYFAWKCVVSFRQVFWRREKAQQSFFFLRYFDLKGCLMVGCVC